MASTPTLISTGLQPREYGRLESPAFQRWNVCHTRTSPEGTAERWPEPVHVQPSLRDSNSSDVLPDVETPGYSRLVPPGQWFALRPGNFRKPFDRSHARAFSPSPRVVAILCCCRLCRWNFGSRMANSQADGN